jgi:integrase
MPKQLYMLDELTPEWKNLREKTIRYCKSKNHSKNSISNAERISISIATNMQSMGIMQPKGISIDDFNNWIEGCREGKFRSKELSEDTIAKRVETIRNMCRAGSLKEQLEFIGNWKSKRVVKEKEFWAIEEMNSMDEMAHVWMLSENNKPKAIAHLILSLMAPRISDMISMRWDSIRFREGIIKFQAKKNSKICQQYLTNDIVKAIRIYWDWVSDFPGGDIYLFPASIVRNSGKKRSDAEHISDKTLRKWIKDLRKEVTAKYKIQIQDLRFHCYRHTLAARYLEKGCTYENISLILGDDVATIEKYYADLRPNKAQRMAFERAFSKPTSEDATETAQPKWMKRKVNRNSASSFNTTYSLGGLSEMVDAGGFEPPATWLQTRCSSKLS